RREQVLVVAKNTEFGGIRLRHNAAIMRHMSTANVARDMDLLRRALGDQKLTIYGASYGSYLGNVYTGLFPGRVRAPVSASITDRPAGATARGTPFRPGRTPGTPAPPPPPPRCANSSSSATAPGRGAPSPPVTPKRNGEPYWPGHGGHLSPSPAARRRPT